MLRKLDIELIPKADKLGHTNRIYSVKCSSENKNIVYSAGWDESIFIWDTRVGHCVNTIFGPLVCGDSLDCKGNELLTGSWRDHDQLQLWDLRKNQLAFSYIWSNFDSEKDAPYIYSCQFSKTKENQIIAGSTGQFEVRVFDKVTGRCYDICNRFEKGVNSLHYGKNNNLVCYGDSSGEFGILTVTP